MESQKQDKHAIDRYAGQTLRNLRQKNNLSQSELGGILGISAQQIHKLEAGKNALSLYHLSILQAHFGAEPDEFLEGFLDKSITKSKSYIEIRLSLAELNSKEDAEKILAESHKYAFEIRHLLHGVTFGGM